MNDNHINTMTETTEDDTSEFPTTAMTLVACAVIGATLPTVARFGWNYIRTGFESLRPNKDLEAVYYISESDEDENNQNCE